MLATTDNYGEQKQKSVAAVTSMKKGEDVLLSFNRHEYANNGNFQAQTETGHACSRITANKWNGLQFVTRESANLALGN